MAEYVHAVRPATSMAGSQTTRRCPPHCDSRGMTQQNYPATHPRAPRVDGTPPGPPNPRRQANFHLPAEGLSHSLASSDMPRFITDQAQLQGPRGYGKAGPGGGTRGAPRPEPTHADNRSGANHNRNHVRNGKTRRQAEQREVDNKRTHRRQQHRRREEKVNGN